MFRTLRPLRDRLAARLRIALAVGVGFGCCVCNGTLAYAATSSQTVSGSQMLRFAWLRDGQSQLWQVDGSGAAVGFSPQGAGVLPATLETPLGSVWKLFVYGYLVDRNIATPDYACNGGDPEEVYCCMTGGHIDREHALVQSCGLFFERPHGCAICMP
jgi:uncharacterized protein YfaQ (DUF2300 family)